MTSPIETARAAFNDGHAIPVLGLGNWKAANNDAASLVADALDAGYRLIDTATIYRNEAGVGEGLRQSATPRDEIFVTTKLWNDDQGYDAALRAFDRSSTALGLERIDLYLIHWPQPARGQYVESWRALVRLRDEGRIGSIGVSNFDQAQIERIADDSGVVPVLNQIELHPRLQQRELRAFHAARGIVTQSWSPLGQGALLSEPTIVEIAAKHARTSAQIVLRWHLDSGLVTIPKASDRAHMRGNLAIGGFTLDAEDMTAIAGLDAGQRYGPDPAVFVS